MNLNSISFAKPPSRELLHAALVLAFKYQPDQALEYLKKRGGNLVTTEAWNELTRREHQESFTVAKIAKASILQKIFDTMETAAKEGKSLHKIKKEIGAMDVMPEHRIKTMWQTNMGVSYSNGRYNQQKIAAEHSDLKYWQYIQRDRVTRRPNHEKYHLKVFRSDDPIWDKIYPKRGYNCACAVRALTGAEMKSEGLELNKGTDFDVINDEGWDYDQTEGWEPDLDVFEPELRGMVKKDLDSQKGAESSKPEPEVKETADPVKLKMKNDILDEIETTEQFREFSKLYWNGTFYGTKNNRSIYLGGEKIEIADPTEFGIYYRMAGIMERNIESFTLEQVKKYVTEYVYPAIKAAEKILGKFLSNRAIDKTTLLERRGHPINIHSILGRIDGLLAKKDQKL